MYYTYIFKAMSVNILRMRKILKIILKTVRLAKIMLQKESYGGGGIRGRTYLKK